MLFEFHKWQNTKRPGSVHATYLIYGVKKNASGPQSQPDGDVEMTSSLPQIEEAEETVPIFTMSLVKEEELNGRTSH
jgi:DNA polymerase delta subunit 3